MEPRSQADDKKERPSAGVRRELGEDRTEWAEQRTLLAKERTFAAWMRTGLAMTATGVGFGQFLRKLDPGWAVKGMATILICAAIGTFALGFWRHRKASRHLEHSGLKRTPIWNLGIIVCAMIVASLLGLIVVLW